MNLYFYYLSIRARLYDLTYLTTRSGPQPGPVGFSVWVLEQVNPVLIRSIRIKELKFEP